MKEYFGPYLQKFGLKQIPELDERPENLSKILNPIPEQSIQTEKQNPKRCQRKNSRKKKMKKKRNQENRQLIQSNYKLLNEIMKQMIEMQQENLVRSV